ncbi:hypothetical protein DPMN_035085 [Dreissena polymorpha]|uniref:Uncharacterized protein n=1 Tax=Dreissena polymorpha TaxID=45954 RepID=A0A9D4M8V4_DREPO|nr:hypothetical protein DPMN_035085 [Dreissena polymorpha]
MKKEDIKSLVAERLLKLEHITDGADIAAAKVTSRLNDLERESNSLRDDQTYVKAQSIRNKVVFIGVPETENKSPETNEQGEDTEKTSERFTQILLRELQTLSSLRGSTNRLGNTGRFSPS